MKQGFQLVAPGSGWSPADPTGFALKGRRAFLFDTGAPGGWRLRGGLAGSEPDAEWEGFLREGGLQIFHKRFATAGSRGVIAGAVDFDGWGRFAHYPAPFCPAVEPGWLSQFPAGELRFEAPFSSATDASAYCRMVRAAQEFIAAGDIYQVNLAHRFQSRYFGEPSAFYATLRRSSPAPYAVYLDQGSRIVVSSSPECFLRMRGRRIVTMPIKGTRPRGRDAAEDRLLQEALETSEKERAELLMITDLLRNDLGQICDYGTIEVSKLFALRMYAHVMHLVSRVEGQLRHGCDHATALVACFPGGSISGAPKRRAIEVLQSVEGEARGLYTGAIGYMDFHGRSEFAIAIRTMIFEPQKGVKARGTAHFHVGAGIVADSVPEAEYEETLAKARGLLAAAACHGAVAL